MARYLPYAGRNAVVEIMIGLNYTHTLENVAATYSDKIRSALASDFPRYEPMNIVSVNISSPGFPTGPGTNPTMAGFVLSMLKNDGTPARMLRVVANGISLHFFSFDDWESIKTSATTHLSKVVGIIEAATPHLIGAFFVRIIDRFTFDGLPAEADTSMLFNRSNKYLAAICFSSGPAWHSNAGWFEATSANDRILHQLSVASGQVGNVVTVNIDHNATIGLPQPRRTIGELLSPKEGVSLTDALNWAQKTNSNILRDLLIQSVAAAIGLQ